MDDDNLDTYIEHVTADLKRAEYSNEDIKKALDKIVVDSHNKKFFLVQYYIYSLILGIVFSSLAIGFSIIITHTLMYFTAIFFVFASLAYLLYFCFKFFDSEEKSILKVSISLSVLVSLASIVVHIIISRKITEFFWLNNQLQDVVFSYPISIYALIILLLITYNVLPIVFIVNKRKKLINFEDFSE
jgi:hypothetical protein